MDLSSLFGGVCSSTDQCAALVLKMVTSKQWGLLAAVGGVVSIQLAKKFLAHRIPFLKSRVGGWVISVAGAVSLAVVTALMAGQTITVALLLGAVSTGLAGVGLFSSVKNTAQAVKEGQDAAAKIHTKVAAIAAIDRAMQAIKDKEGNK